MKYISSFFLLLMGGCTNIPSNLEPINSFDFNKYLGTWYEIARLDHSFERGLSDVKAQYTLLDNGNIQVVNQGYSKKSDKWKTVTGTAKFVGTSKTGHLKVSFFGPFYSSYIILYLDQESYNFALVCGPNRDYLWILARKQTLSESQTKILVEQASSMGFAVDDLIFVSHENRYK